VVLTDLNREAGAALAAGSARRALRSPSSQRGRLRIA
jgi:hypothetical protein